MPGKQQRGSVSPWSTCKSCGAHEWNGVLQKQACKRSRCGVKVDLYAAKGSNSKEGKAGKVPVVGKGPSDSVSAEDKAILTLEAALRCTEDPALRRMIQSQIDDLRHKRARQSADRMATATDEMFGDLCSAGGGRAAQAGRPLPEVPAQCNQRVGLFNVKKAGSIRRPPGVRGSPAMGSAGARGRAGAGLEQHAARPQVVGCAGSDGRAALGPVDAREGAGLLGGGAPAEDGEDTGWALGLSAAALLDDLLGSGAVLCTAVALALRGAGSLLGLAVQAASHWVCSLLLLFHLLVTLLPPRQERRRSSRARP
ncbi:unnamed protein product [Prorocentrum cordatum]|uniref:Uncharacterized protein n=1 Tax=Prorocentrum cordatum TaxID=2364126 RepID=A0ABN9X070_9DINO|nr:unnamed protein product [Polarella glacialis]